MIFKDKIKSLERNFVAINLDGNHTLKGSLEKVEDDFIVIKISGGSEAYIQLEKIVSVLETL